MAADRWQIQISLANDFASTVRDETVFVQSYQPASDLAASTLHYWRVRAGDGVDWSDWSAVWSFTTQAGPTTYQISLSGSFPAPSGTLAPRVKFSSALFGVFPAPEGSLRRKTSKATAGAMPAPEGSLRRKTSKIFTGEMPAPEGSLSEGYRTRQSISGVMGSITGTLGAVFKQGGGVVKRILNRIRLGIGIGI